MLSRSSKHSHVKQDGRLGKNFLHYFGRRNDKFSEVDYLLGVYFKHVASQIPGLISRSYKEDSAFYLSGETLLAL